MRLLENEESTLSGRTLHNDMYTGRVSGPRVVAT